MKFHPELFPVGTVFRIDPDLTVDPFAGEPYPDTYEVVAVHRNGVRSYALETTTPRRLTEKVIVPAAFNLCHVRQILKRGDGPLKINDHGWGIQSPPRYWEGYESWTDYGYGRGCYKRLTLMSIVEPILCRLLREDKLIDWDRLLTDLSCQNWTSLETPSSGFGKVVFVNRKRLRGWLKRNANRYLLPLDEAEYRADQADLLDQEVSDDEDYDFK